MIGMLSLNTIEAEATFGIIVTGFGGDLSAPSRSLSLLALPSLPGAIDPGLTPNESTRTLTIEFMVNAEDDASVHATLDNIKEVCGTGTVEIQTMYSTSRILYGVLVSLEASGRRPWIAGWVGGTMTFVCSMPYWVANTPTVVSFGSTATEIALGTAPSAGRDSLSALITITGAATTPTLTYADSTGATVGTMICNGYSPAAGDSIVIDCGRRIITRYVSGVASNAISYFTAGYTFPALDPADGSFRLSTWPTLKTSAGTGSITYYKHYR